MLFLLPILLLMDFPCSISSPTFFEGNSSKKGKGGSKCILFYDQQYEIRHSLIYTTKCTPLYKSICHNIPTTTLKHEYINICKEDYVQSCSVSYEDATKQCYDEDCYTSSQCKYDDHAAGGYGYKKPHCTPVKNCKKICKVIPRKKCNQVPTSRCHKGLKQVPKKVYKKVCSKVPTMKCAKVPKTKVISVPVTVPRKVCEKDEGKKKKKY